MCDIHATGINFEIGMGRKQSNPVYRSEFFIRDETNRNVYICQCKCTTSNKKTTSDSDLDGTSNFELKTCLQEIQGQHGPSNLEKHLKHKHPEDFEKIRIIKETKKDKEKTTIGTQPPEKRMKLVQTKLPNASKKVLKLQVLVSIEYIKDACILLVTEDGRPLRAVEDKAWKKILKPYLDALRDAKIKFKVNRHKARDWMTEKAKNVKMAISKTLKDKLFHLKVDATTKYRRSFLGINAQYLNDDNEIQVLTLATADMFDYHTAENIKEIILEVLKSYNLNEDQIYAFVSDNGSNMLKTAKLFNVTEKGLQQRKPRRQSRTRQDAISSDDEDNDSVISLDNQDHEDSDEWEDFSVEEQMVDEKIYNREELLKDFLQSTKLEDKLNSIWKSTDNVVSIRCAAHTLQLGIYDAWKNYEKSLQKKKDKSQSEVANAEVELDFELMDNEEHVEAEAKEEESQRVSILDKVRQMVKKLRTSHGTILLNHLSSKLQPILENDTRWCSTYDMIERFLTMKGDVQELSKTDDFYYLTVSQWDEIQTIKNSLEPCKKATLLLQNEQCTLRDLSIIISDCIADTKKIDHEIAKILADCVSERKDKLFENISFLSSLYLDPCSKVFLTADQKKLVTEHLCNLYERIFTIKNRSTESAQVVENASASASTSTPESSESAPAPATATVPESNQSLTNTRSPAPPCSINELASKIASINQAVKSTRESESSNAKSKLVESLKLEMTIYETENLPVDENEICSLLTSPVMKFWSDKKKMYPNLFEVARIIHSVPTSQTSVERLFSSLDFILNKKRSRLITKALNDILIIRSNKNCKM